MRRGWEHLGCLVWRKGGNLIALCSSLCKGSGEGEAKSLLPGNQWQGAREEHKAVPEEIQAEHWGKFPYYEGGQALGQAFR